MRRFVLLAMLALTGTAGAQQFYSGPQDLPKSGRDSDVVDACWRAIRGQVGDAPVQTEAIMVPVYKPLTEARLRRYGLGGPAQGRVYADTSFIIATTDPAGVVFSLAMRCEIPFDPKAPDFSRVYLTEDRSLNPNFPPEDRPARD